MSDEHSTNNKINADDLKKNLPAAKERTAEETEAIRKMVKSKLLDARCKIQITDPFYGVFATRFKWVEDERVGTMGVSIKKDGSVMCYYSPEFCNTMTVDNLVGIIKHEVEHIMRVHLGRFRSRNRLEHHFYNIAADWVINGPKDESRRQIKDLPECGAFRPDHNDPVWGKCPDIKNVTESSTTEELYEFILKNTYKKHKEDKNGNGENGKQGDEKGNGGKGQKGQKGQKGDQDSSGSGDDDGEGDGEESDGANGNGSKKGKKKSGGNGDEKEDKGITGQDDKGEYEIKAKGSNKTVANITHDNHEMWDESDATPDEMRQVAKELTRTAAQQAGTTPGHLSDIISALDKPQYSWVFLLRQFIGRHAGSKRKTYSRKNRRYPAFGVKGTSSHASVPMTIFVDSSGSMSTEILKKVFSEVDSVSQHFKIMVVVYDTQIQQIEAWRKGDLGWLKQKGVKGRGGTCVNSALTEAEQKGLIGRVNLIFTDGYDSAPQKKKYPILMGIFGHDGFQHMKNQKPDFQLIELKDR